MGNNTGIGWTDHTLNIWTGCTKISPGCKFCYMYRDKERYGLDPTIIMPVSDKTINQVLKKAKPGEKVFINSWSDFCISDPAVDKLRDKAWAIIKSRPDLIFQILTKRADNIVNCLPEDWGNGDAYSNVWFGVSIESNEYLGRLQQIFDALHNPNRKYKIFVSFEPLLGPITLLNDSVVTQHIFETMVDWVIIGGESGNDTGNYRYRPCELVWIIQLLVECNLKNKPAFFKQTGTYLAKKYELESRHGSHFDEWPSTLKIQQFPQ